MKFGIAGLLVCTALAGCEREVILEGERFPVRAPLEASEQVEGEAAPVAPSGEPVNVSQPISLPAMQSNAEWSHRGGNSHHGGIHGALSAAPQRVWSVAIGAGNSKRNRVSAAPVVSSGRVFAMDSRSELTAVSMGGAVQWKTSLLPEFDRSGTEVSGGGLAATGGRVYATTGFGELVALDAASGKILWRQRFDGPVSGAPTVEGNTVYAVSSDGVAVAVDAANGKIRWSAGGVRSSKGVVGPGSPAINGGDVIVPFASGQISAYAAADGAGVWGAAVAGQRVGRAYAVMGDITGDPVVSGGVIYTGTASGRTVAVNAADGKRLWTALEGALNPPLVVGGSVFIVNDEARLIRLDAGTGEVIWSVAMPYYTNDKAKKMRAIYAHYGPVLAGGRIVVASSDGNLRMFSPVDGNLLATAEIGGGAASPPALAGGMLFVMGGNGQLQAFR